MKTIVFIVECFEKGVGKHVTDLYKNLKKDSEINIKILIGSSRIDKDFLKNIDENDKYIIKSLKDGIGINDLISLFEIRKLLKDLKPDIVHCHSSKAGFAGRIAAKLSGVKKIIYSPHAYVFLKYKENSFKQKVFLFIEKFLSKFFTNYTITTSQGEDEVFIKNIDKPEKRVLIEHGLVRPIISEDKRRMIREKYGVTENDIFIGAMSRFDFQKDPITTFKVLDGLHDDKNKNVKTIFFGSGKLFDEVVKLNKNNNVIFPGNVENPDEYLNALDIFVTTSLYEGLPYTLIETLSLGLPIVATNVIGNNSCVFDNYNGVLFEIGQYEEAIKKINQIICESKIKEMSKNSLKVFDERFNINTMLEKYRKVYIDE